MLKIEDIKTPTTVEEFRDNLKKYCLGKKDSIFIYNKINDKQFCIDINKISKMSDIFELIKDDNLLGNNARKYNVILMCDISHINERDIILKDKDTIDKLKEVYLFNNQDSEERSNFLNSTPIAIERIVAREKVINEIDAKPKQTAIDYKKFRGLYFHLFGEYFDTVSGAKKEFNLSKYN